MSQQVGPPHPPVPPPDTDPGRDVYGTGRPSLRWRLRRWILRKLDAWPRAHPEPTTEWGRLRRAERIALTQEVARLRALEDRLTRSLDYRRADVERAGDQSDWQDGHAEAYEDIRYLVVDGHLDEMLAEFAESGDELAAEYVREGA